MPQVIGKVNRTLPATFADSAQAQERMGRYGEPIVIQLGGALYPIADEGQYFRAMEQTPGTPRAAAIQTSFSATSAILALQNNDSAGGKRIYLDYIRMLCTTAPASATAAHIAIAIDNTNRYSSGGTALTPVNANMDLSTAAIGVLHYGAVVAGAASGSVRYLSRSQLRAVIPVIGDEWVFNFSSPDSPNSQALNGTAPTRFGIPFGPLVVGPTGTILIHYWAPANAVTAMSFELEAGWWER